MQKLTTYVGEPCEEKRNDPGARAAIRKLAKVICTRCTRAIQEISTVSYQASVRVLQWLRDRDHRVLHRFEGFWPVYIMVVTKP